MKLEEKLDEIHAQDQKENADDCEEIVVTISAKKDNES